MTRISISRMLIIAVALAVLGGIAPAAEDKNAVKVPDGFGFAEFKGYEDWQAVGPSLTDAQHVIRLILANPTMIQAYRDGIPGNGKPFPDGSKTVKIEWRPRQITDKPFSAAAPDVVPGVLFEIEFIQKDSKRFADSNGGWGYAPFNYDDAADKFTPIGTGYKCGTACHTLAKANDYIFTAYPKR